MRDGRALRVAGMTREAAPQNGQRDQPRLDDHSEMSLAKGLPQDWIDLYLAPWVEGSGLTSCFAAVLRDARGAARRDVGSGLPAFPDHSTSWLGTVGYMILLDQLGSVLKPKGTKTTDRPFADALAGFADPLEVDDVEALYALRCCLVHDYSLVHAGKNAKPPRHFNLWSNDTAPLVEHPDVPWDGQVIPIVVNERVYSTTTFVNTRAFADLVESLVENARAKAAAGELEIALPDGRDGIVFRYCFRIGSED